MGNLYTHIIRTPNRRIQILSRLKYEFRCYPRNTKIIEELRAELKKLDDRSHKPRWKLPQNQFTQKQLDDYKKRMSSGG